MKNILFTIFGIVIVSLMLRNMYKAAPPSQLFKSFKKRKWISLAQFISAIALFPAFYSTMSFFGAETPEEAMAKYGIAMPTHWEAGVMNHGKYYQWYTIENHPVFFGISLITLICTILFIWYSCLHMWLLKRKINKYIHSS